MEKQSSIFKKKIKMLPKLNLLMEKHEFIKKLEKYVKRNFYGDLHHGWPHMNRVRKYAKFIAEKEGADVFIVEVAALLHDIAKIKYGPQTKNHAKKGAEMAEKILINWV